MVRIYNPEGRIGDKEYMDMGALKYVDEKLFLETGKYTQAEQETIWNFVRDLDGVRDNEVGGKEQLVYEYLLSRETKNRMRTSEDTEIDGCATPQTGGDAIDNSTIIPLEDKLDHYYTQLREQTPDISAYQTVLAENHTLADQLNAISANPAFDGLELLADQVTLLECAAQYNTNMGPVALLAIAGIAAYLIATGGGGAATLLPSIGGGTKDAAGLASLLLY